MTQILTHRLNKGFTIQVGEPHNLPANLENQVADIWHKEKTIRGNQLTNGKIFSLVEFNKNVLLIEPCEYRYVLANRRNPELQESGLLVKPLAVTGIICCQDGIILGKRGGSVSDDIGLWEPVPAGGLTQENPENQIYEELKEELGLTIEHVSSIKTCGLVEDSTSNVFDIIYRINIDLQFRDVFNAHRLCKSAEHSKIEFVANSAINSFLQKNIENLLPALPSMLEIADLIQS